MPGSGLSASISPGVPCPETVLVALLADGSYLLVGRCRQMPAALVASQDAAPLRQALESAFNRPTVARVAR